MAAFWHMSTGNTVAYGLSPGAAMPAGITFAYVELVPVLSPERTPAKRRGETLVQIFANGGLPTVTVVFMCGIAALTTWMLAFRYSNRTVIYGPTLLTTLGIFGCFLGIALGLAAFNTRDIQGSVPALVDGIKTSFWSSIFGIGGALLIKLRFLFFGPPVVPQNQAPEGATIDDLAQILVRLQQSIAGQDDSTLLSQIKLQRQDTNDRLDLVRQSLEQYMEKMAESNSKALIEALKEVIKDFNAKINEQFGENFKHLNMAVERILVWQEKYRNQMQEMIEQQRLSARSMTEANLRLAELAGKSQIFTQTAESLGRILVGVETQREQIHSTTEKLGTLLLNAESSLPNVEKKIIELANQLDAGVRANNDQINATIRTVTQSLQSSNAEMKRLLAETVQTANNEMNVQIKSLTEKTKEQVTVLDAALQTELTKSLESLGSQLTALSRHFVEDYTPLTDKLKSLVQLSMAT